MNGGSGGAFALVTKLLHPRPKAVGVEQQSAVLETGRNFRFLALAPCRSLRVGFYHQDDLARQDTLLLNGVGFLKSMCLGGFA